MENKIRTGIVINPKSGKTYNTRDTLNLVRLAKLAQAMNDWKRANEWNKSPAVQRKVRAIQTSMWLGLENQSEGK